MMTMPVSNKEKCICQICICGEHRCDFIKTTQLNQTIAKTEDKTKVEFQDKVLDQESAENDENKCYQQKEKCRKQWERSPDQIKEITRSLSQINGSHFDKTDQEPNQSKTCVRDKSDDSQVNRSILPPINTLSDSDSGKELDLKCICEQPHKSNSDIQGMDKCINSSESQWVVTRPKRTRPKDNLRLEGPMELKTTFNTTYDSTAKQINESLSKSVAIVMPCSKPNSEENLAEKQSQLKINNSNVMRSSKKKSKVRPSTSLKAGGDGYFNTVSKESYKNFVIINDNSKVEKPSPTASTNGKKSNVCCSTVANIKLPKVDTNHKDEKQTNRRQSKELNSKSVEIEQINRSMHRMTTEESKIDSTNSVAHESERSKDALIQSLVETQNNTNTIENRRHNGKQQPFEKTSVNNNKIVSNQSEKISFSTAKETNSSWTIGTLEEPRRVVTRDVDNIKEMGLLDAPNELSIRSKQIKTKETTKQSSSLKETKVDSNTENTNSSTRVRIESKHYVQSERRQKKHKNESSMKLFDGDMDFATTTKTFFADVSPNRAQNNTESTQALRKQQHTAGKRTRKSGRKPNLFRTSTEAQFCQPIGDKITETTYQNQFGDRLYCPALDLGSVKSDFKFKGESSGHKFFLPAVKY